MKKDTKKNRVQFLVHEIPGEIHGEKCTYESDVFAYFPDENYDPRRGLKSCYAHVGQHSSCHPDYAKESRPATPAEYADLKAELESIGYSLEIL